ncbi:hypothetical protein DPEC_G00138550 [Dallia pectoralis]|uniref:Uncharacterized protein n=1 Tax=Dallia pectoralis TaxID=75939 RepID=A0ACC2GM03_DALPE|nr:hypothetical protein DPEC_G00138550 [Dallia pectoralis]
MEFLKSTHTNLCQCLSTDAHYIIKKCEDVLSVKQGKAVCKQNTDAGKVDILLKTIVEKGEETCEWFYEILKEEQSRYPGLQKHFSESLHVTPRSKVYADGGSTVDVRKVTGVQMNKGLNMGITIQAEGLNAPGVNPKRPPGCADMVATNSSSIFASEVSQCTIDGDFNYSVIQAPPSKVHGYSELSKSKKIKVNSTRPIKDASGFLKRHRVNLVSKVTNVKPVVDTMQSTVYQDEMAANVNAQLTNQEKMRKLLDSVKSSKASEALIQALITHQKDVMDDLMAEDASREK